MNKNTTYITTATVRFYENLYLFPKSENYNWIIRLEDCPLCSANNRIYVELHKSYERALRMSKAARHYFAMNHIFDGTKASIIFNSEGIIAIGTNGSDNYLDVRDNFVAKPFSKLGIDITSLIVMA